MASVRLREEQIRRLRESGNAAALIRYAVKRWKRGDFTPEKFGTLYNAGANWDGMPAVDLAGHSRLRGPAVDIGAFEWTSPEPTVMLLR